MLKHLTLAEMVALISPWVGKTKRRELFLSIPEIVPLQPLAVEAHAAVLAVRPVDDTPSPELQAVTLKGIKLDNRHDHRARAITLTLDAARSQALGANPADEARAAACERANAQLFPEGMSIVIASFLAESGNTARVEKLLKDQPEIGKLLQSVTAPSKTKATLLEVVEDWIAIGQKLAAAEQEREELLAQTVPASKASIQEARSQWFRVVSAVLANLDLSRAPIETIEGIRGPVLRASERAGKRYANGAPETPVLDPEDATPPEK